MAQIPPCLSTLLSFFPIFSNSNELSAKLGLRGCWEGSSSPSGLRGGPGGRWPAGAGTAWPVTQPPSARATVDNGQARVAAGAGSGGLGSCRTSAAADAGGEATGQGGDGGRREKERKKKFRLGGRNRSKPSFC